MNAMAIGFSPGSFDDRELFNFSPSAARAQFLDQRMRSRLADSLSHVFAETQGAFSLPSAQLQAFLAQLTAGPISPLAFSFYCDLVIALEQDDLAEARRLIQDLIRLPPHAGGPDVVDLGDPQTDPHGERYARFLNADLDAKFEIVSPAPSASQSCRQQIRDAFALMDAADPELSAEIRALLREIVLAAGTEDPKAMTFDGASAFMLWGGIIINANRRDGALGMAQMLAHESAHNLLFGICTDEPLLLNAPEERYASPLRVDLRPLEGIYHATFVSARMYRVVKNLLNHGKLAAEVTAKAQKDLADNARYFSQGFATVNQHAKLTELGGRIMKNAADYMQANGGLIVR